MKPANTKTDPKTRKSLLGKNQIVDTAEHFVLLKKEDNTGIQLSPYALSKFTNEIYAKSYSLIYGIEP